MNEERELAVGPGGPPAPQPARVERLLERAVAWARQQPDIRGLALVGSWARGAARADSDVDLVLLTSHPDRYLADDDWTAALGPARVLHTQAWGSSPNGACWSRATSRWTWASPTRRDGGV